MLGYPYWLMFEYLAPIVEFLGILWFIFLADYRQTQLALLPASYGFCLLFCSLTFHLECALRRDYLPQIREAKGCATFDGDSLPGTRFLSSPGHADVH